MRQNEKKLTRIQIEQENLAQIKYFESMDRINRAMQGSNDLEQVMKDVLDTMLSVFECDRAWLGYPCDPDATTWQTSMERTRPEYPGVLPIGVELPLEPAGAGVFRILRNATGPVKFGPEAENQVPKEIAEVFRVKSFIAMAIYPRIGEPWFFGLHQCSSVRVWNPEEERLFEEIGKRLSDTLTSILAYRNLQESEKEIKQLIDASPVAMIVSSGIEEHVESVNAKFTELFGYSIEDVPNVAHWWPLAYPDEKYRKEIKSKWEERIQKTIKDKVQIEPMEAIVVCKDGSHRYVEFRLSSVGEKHLVTFVDLTERWQAEDELRKNREAAQLFSKQLETLQEVINKLSKVESSDDLCLQAVQLGRSCLGFDRVSIWFIDEQLSIMRGSFGTDEHGELRDERNSQVEFRHEGLAWLLFSHKEPKALVEHGPLYDHQGREVGQGENTLAALWDGDEVIGVICVDNLFTGQPIGEHQLEILRLYATTLGHLISRKQAEDELRASEVRFRTFVDHAADAFFLHDERGIILDVNRQTCKSLGYSREELIGMLPPDFDAGADVDKPSADQVESRLDAGETVVFETRHRRKDRSVFPVEVRVCPFWQDERRFSVSLARDITERKGMEEALRANEDRLQLALDAAKMGQWEWNITTGEIFWSQQCLALYGLPPETSMSYEKFLQALHPDDRERIDAALSRAVEERSGYDEVKRTIWPDGTIHWTASRGQVYCDAAGEPIRMVGVTFDISNWKEAEAQLLASEQLFRALVENSPDFIARYDRDFRRIYVNPAIQSLFKGSREGVLDKTPDDQSPIFTPQVYIEHLQQAIETATENIGEMPFRTAHGEMHWGQIRFVPEFDSDGKVSTVLAIGRDIHEIKENEQRFRMLAENFPDFVIRFDHDGRCTYANPSVEELSSLPAEVLVGKTLQELLHFGAPEQNDMLLALIQDSIDKGIPHETEAYWESEMGPQIFEIRFAPEKDAVGNVVSVLSIARDITERKRAQEALTLFRTLIDHANEIIEVADPETGRFLDVNECACLAHGYTREEYLALTIPEINPVVAARTWNDSMEELRSTGSLVRESQHRRKDGSIFPVEINVNYVRLDRDYILSVVRDITERKQAEEKLLASETRFRTFVDHAADAFFLHDERGIVLDVNRQACKSLGYTREELIGMSPYSFDAAADSQVPSTDQVESRLDAGETVAFETRHLRKDGSSFPVEVRGRPFWQGNRRFSVSLARDISERKEAEQAIRESEERLRQIASSLREAIWLRDAQTRQVLYVNPAFEALTGRTCESFYENRDIVIDAIHPDDKEGVIGALKQRFEGIPFDKEHRLVHLDGSVRWISSRIFPVRNEAGEVYRWASIMEDITERKQADEELKNAHEQLERSLMFNEALLSAIPTPVFYKDKEGRYLGCNQAFTEFTGVSSDQIKGKTAMELWPSENAEVYHKKDLELMHSLEQQIYEFIVQDKDGVDHPVIFAKNVFRDENNQVAGIVGAFLDITERRQAEIERQTHLRFLESMDQINRVIQGTSDLDQMMSDVLDVVLTIFDCDRVGLVYPCDPDAASWHVPMEKTRPEFPGALILESEIPMDSGVAQKQRTMRASNGPVKFGPESKYPLPTKVSKRFGIQSLIGMALYPKTGKPWEFMLQQCSYPRVWTSDEERLFQEIGRRLADGLNSLLAFRNLQESEERYRQLVNVSPDAIIVYSQGRVEFVNPAAVRLAGANSEEELVGNSVLDFVQPDYREYVEKALEQIQRTGVSALFVEENFVRVDGTKLDVEVAIVPYQFQDEDHIQILARNISVRKQHEREREAIITVSAALRHARTQSEILNVILHQLVELFNADGTILVLPNPNSEGCINEMGRGAVGERMIGLNIPPGKGVGNWVITNKTPYINNHADGDPLFYRPDLLGDSHCLIAAPLIAQEQAIGALMITRKIDFVEQDLHLLTAISDIAANAFHRVTLYEQTEQQLDRLVALHQIDLAISTNFDLSITLDVLLGNVKDELEVDAVSILLLDSVAHTLDYAAGIGFRTDYIERSHVRIGEGCAGRAAQEHRTISCKDLGQESGIYVRSSLLASEDFVAHYATPLVVKGQVKGVLEFFNRNTLKPEHTWLSYFETLATQAAIAIENTSLFESLQRSNLELTLAYDATIEGWSRALDLRDKETEGHTQRVAEMTLKLAEIMGMSDAEKIDLRRGALLHDIGKMGVPDAILFKSEPLSEDEWELMRQHPIYAYQMLSPIAYLKAALEIPYCHHEKWDGSGYPRGLKGKQIPLAARLFAVVDVWDALTSNRPYRLAWPTDEIVEYIRDQAGKYFDPEIVELFLQVLGEQDL